MPPLVGRPPPTLRLRRRQLCPHSPHAPPHPQVIVFSIKSSEKGERLGRAFVRPRQGHAIPPGAIARAIAFAIEQAAEVDVNEIVIRSGKGITVDSLVRVVFLP